MQRIKTLITEEHGAITTDWTTLVGLVGALTLILFASAQNEVDLHLSQIETLLSATTTMSLH